jgi:hypothetical protein
MKKETMDTYIVPYINITTQQLTNKQILIGKIIKMPHLTSCFHLSK